MIDLDLAYTPATELARMIRERQISPVEIVRNSLERIDATHAALNCFCFTYPEEALSAAAAAEKAVMSGVQLGPLHGVPFALKDFTPTRGKTTTRGSCLLEHWVPDTDPVIFRRLREAGGILIGKTTTPEFATSGFTRSRLWGETRNPWDQARTPGGSSGGSGAAVAAGCVALAEGTDMGGSVRIPAALCGIVGLKPSLGRIPMDILWTVFDDMSHFGPLARTSADAALFLDITQGAASVDIQSLPRIHIPRPPEEDVRGLRIALSHDLGFSVVDEGIRSNLERVADALVAAGAYVEPVDLGWDGGIIELWNEWWCVYIASAFQAAFGDTFQERRDELVPAVAAMIERGLTVPAVAVRVAEKERTRYWNELAAVLERFDALLCPTMAVTAPQNTLDDADFCSVEADGRMHCMDLTSPFNCMAQCPAISVPSGFVDGLPSAAQFVTRRWDDVTALRLAAAVERAMPWADARPTL